MPVWIAARCCFLSGSFRSRGQATLCTPLSPSVLSAQACASSWSYPLSRRGENSTYRTPKQAAFIPMNSTNTSMRNPHLNTANDLATQPTEVENNSLSCSSNQLLSPRENILETLGQILSLYGWKIQEEAKALYLCNRSGKRVCSLSLKTKDRIQLRSDARNKTLASIPRSTPEQIGILIEKAFYATKL